MEVNNVFLHAILYSINTSGDPVITTLPQLVVCPVFMAGFPSAITLLAPGPLAMGAGCFCTHFFLIFTGGGGVIGPPSTPSGMPFTSTLGAPGGNTGPGGDATLSTPTLAAFAMSLFICFG
jgi:hypothetical protein